MARDARFWRNVTIIALAHIALLLSLIRWSRESKRAGTKEIVWMDAGAGQVAEAVPQTALPSSQSTPEVEELPEPTPEAKREPAREEEPEEKPVLTASKSEIELPTATPRATPSATPAPKPTGTPTPKPSPPPKPTPKPTPRPTPKAKPSPKKKLVAKASPQPTAAPKEKAEKEESSETKKKKEIAKAALAKKSAEEGSESSDKATGKTTAQGNKKSGEPGAGGADGSGEGGTSEFGWYGNMLHDRFYSEWVQPMTVVASNAKLSALVKIRIEKDGRVSDFKVIKPSGNVVIDESVEAVAKRVTQVDPLPAGLGGDHYDVQINFELDNQ